MKSGIYMILNLVNGKSYIGSTVNLGARKAQHLSKLRSGVHANTHLQNAFNSYGERNFLFKILGHVPVDLLNEVEQLCIDEANPEYNVRKIADSNRGLPAWNKGVPCPEELKEKYRNLYTGKKVPKEVVEKIRATKKAKGLHYNTGPRSEEHKAKVSAKLKGIVRSEETKRKMSEAQKRKWAKIKESKE